MKASHQIHNLHGSSGPESVISKCQFTIGRNGLSFQIRIIARCRVNRGELKPEAAYFFSDVKDTSQILAIAEPCFLAFNAKVSLRPIMNPIGSC